LQVIAGSCGSTRMCFIRKRSQVQNLPRP
jgi:hypothetical protein